MNPEDHIQHMLQSIIEQTQSIIGDSRKQSFGSLEYFLGHILEYRDEQQYMSKEWHIRTPRWLGSMAIHQRKKSFFQISTDCKRTLQKS
ncbi:hypothetical protein P9222_29850 [Paenibacillus amylolyticus]|nr:hypothetical protein [Paenibacillus amylolyticus]WFR62374.1 hypothetical protein P9222_29850 [Paenibacillus amylolyticus]